MIVHHLSPRTVCTFLFLFVVLSAPTLLIGQQTGQDREDPPSLDSLVSDLQERVQSLPDLSAELSVKRKFKKETGISLFERIRGTIERKKEEYFRLDAGVHPGKWERMLIDASHYADQDGRSYQLSFSFLRERFAFSWNVQRPYDASPRKMDLDIISGLIGGGTEISLVPVMEYNLHPSSLHVFRNEGTRKFKKRNDTRYVVLSRKRDWSMGRKERDMKIVEEVYIHPEKARVERVQYKLTLKVGTDKEQFVLSSGDVEWKQVNDLAVPGTTNLVLTDEHGAPEHYLVIKMKNLQTKNDAVLSGTPAYADDPAVPDLAPGDSEQIAGRIKEQPDQAALYGKYVSAKALDVIPAILKREMSFKDVDLPAVIRLLEKGAKRVESVFVESMLASLYTLTGRRKKIQQQADRLQETNLSLPFVQLAAAKAKRKSENQEALENYRRLLNASYPYKQVAKYRVLQSTLRTGTPKEMMNALTQRMENLSDEKRFKLLEKIEAPIYKSGRRTKTLISGRSESVLEQLESRVSEDETTSYFLNLLLARARARRGDHRKAMQHFRALPDNEFVHREVNQTVQHVSLKHRNADDQKKGRSVTEFQPIVSKITHPVPLLIFTANAIGNEKKEEAIHFISRIHDHIKEKAKEQEQENRRSGYSRSRWHGIMRHHRASLPNVISFCQKRDRETEARAIIKHFIKTMNLSSIYRRREQETLQFAQVIREVFSDPEPVLYAIAKQGRGAGNRRDTWWIHKEEEKEEEKNPFVSRKKAIQIAVQRCLEGKQDRDDLKFLGGLIQWNELDAVPNKDRLIDALETVRNERSSSDFVMDRLADLLYLSGQYEKAASVFSDEINHMTDTGHYYGRVSAPSSYTNSRQDPKLDTFLGPGDETPSGAAEVEFHPVNSVYIKAALAYRRSGQKKKGSQVLKKHLESMEAYLHGEEFRNAIKAFLILGQSETAVTISQNKFMEAYQKLQNSKRKERRRRSTRDFHQIVEMLLKLYRARGRIRHAVNLCDLASSFYEERRGRGSKTLRSLCKDTRTGDKGDLSEWIEKIRQQHQAEVSDTEQETIQKQIDQLADPSYKKRQKATKKLKQIGPKVVPLLEEALDANNPELQKRAQEIAWHYVDRWIRKQLVGKSK